MALTKAELKKIYDTIICEHLIDLRNITTRSGLLHLFLNIVNSRVKTINLAIGYNFIVWDIFLACLNEFNKLLQVGIDTKLVVHYIHNDDNYVFDHNQYFDFDARGNIYIVQEEKARIVPDKDIEIINNIKQKLSHLRNRNNFKLIIRFSPGNYPRIDELLETHIGNGKVNGKIMDEIDGIDISENQFFDFQEKMNLISKNNNFHNLQVYNSILCYDIDPWIIELHKILKFHEETYTSKDINTKKCIVFNTYQTNNDGSFQDTFKEYLRFVLLFQNKK